MRAALQVFLGLIVIAAVILVVFMVTGFVIHPGMGDGHRAGAGFAICAIVVLSAMWIFGGK